MLTVQILKGWQKCWARNTLQKIDNMILQSFQSLNNEIPKFEISEFRKTSNFAKPAFCNFRILK